MCIIIIRSCNMIKSWPSYAHDKNIIIFYSGHPWLTISMEIPILFGSFVHQNSFIFLLCCCFSFWSRFAWAWNSSSGNTYNFVLISEFSSVSGCFMFDSSFLNVLFGGFEPLIKHLLFKFSVIPSVNMFLELHSSIPYSVRIHFW